MVTSIVRHIPEWLPWLSYKPLARLGYKLGQETMHEPIRFVKESMVSDCFVSACPKAHYVIPIAQWHSTTFTRSRESTRGGKTKRTRTQKDRENDCRSFRVDVRRLVFVSPLKFD
jgi:hypothetical protein